ncbi:MAG: hypothetical protein H8E62_06580 [Planctomycetes bacterium]|nr:hypothetical protein [Planctomycetota bacterium]
MKHRVILTLLIAVSFSSISCVTSSQEEGPGVQAPPQEKPRQLRIFRETLLQGSSEEIRVEAAVELFLRNDAPSRDVLVDILKTADNPQAQAAVSKALVKSRRLGQTVGSQSVYLDPLVQILTTGQSEPAILAAEALLLYDFKDIEKRLDKIIRNAKAEPQGRINVVYALKLRSEPQALRRLIGLLDDTNSDVSSAAESALEEVFGVPVGASRQVWSEILDKLKQKSPEDIRYDRLLLQERRLPQVQAERDRWQKMYMSLLDKQYDGADEAGRSQMTLDMLGTDLEALRIWGLGKVTQYQAADKEALREKLFSLLSDESREVRLQTAKVLNNMSALNPAEKLLENYKLENDPEVALAMFDALGEACFFAFSPGSQIELSSDIKVESMKIAAEYLAQGQTETSRKGAEVIRKILELNNLSGDTTQHYLTLLDERYQKTIGQNPVLRADLLSVMSHLCGQGMPKTQACKLYEPLFIEAITVGDNPPLRLSAVTGMINVDPVKALKLAKDYQLKDIASPAVRQAVVELAGTTGSAEDLDWLLGMLNLNGQAEQAWQAIKAVCQRQTPSFLIEWLPRLGENGTHAEYELEILELAEKKALTDTASETLIQVRERIIRWYIERKAWDHGSVYLSKIEFSVDINPFSEQALSDIFELYLFSGNAEMTTQIIAYYIVNDDTGGRLSLLGGLSMFFDSESVSLDIKRSILDQLLSLDVSAYPNFEESIEIWTSQTVDTLTDQSSQ